MKNNKISGFEINCISYFILRAFFIGISFNGLITILRQNSWTAPILVLPLTFIYILMIAYIMNYKPQINISEKLKSLFGGKIGFVLILLICIFNFGIASLNCLNLTNFIHSQFLYKTPIFAISLIFMITSFYILTKGINVIARASVILYYISILLFCASFIGLIPSFEFSNLKPFLNSSGTDYLKGIIYFYSLNISELFILTIIPKDKIESKNIKKILFISSIISIISIIFVIIFTFATFGYELSDLYQYPEFQVLKHINLINISSRLESILVIQWIFDFLMYNILIIYFISNSLRSIIKVKNINYLYIIICLLILIISNYLSKFNIYIDKFTMRYLNIPIAIFTIGLTLIISLKIKYNKKHK